MGHRALVAYGRGDGCYDVYYSHWGGADLEVAGRLTGPASDPVADDPLAKGVDFASVVGKHLDPLVHEALFVLDEKPRAYRTLWLDFGGTTGESRGGLLVGIDWTDPCDDARVRAWFAGARAVATACREQKGLSRTVAATIVEHALRSWVDDRDVIRPPIGATEVRRTE